MPFYFERALFVVGGQNHGKSTQIRHTLQDVRFHGDGVVPNSNTRLNDIYRLSNERALLVRLRSPHEIGETFDELFEEFLQKKFDRYAHQVRRWNFIGALQPFAFNNMPDAAEVIEKFFARFEPERVRVALISPNRFGIQRELSQSTALVDAFWQAGAEVISIDARQKDKNGLILSDFFDFT